jgi:hypothetical protein
MAAMPVFATRPRFTRDTSRGRIADIPDPRLQRLARYWAERIDDSGCVPRASVDPLDIPALLPHILMLDRIGQPPDERYRYRLVGTDVVQHVGRELTGLHLDEALPGSYHDYVRMMNRLALQERRPVYSSSLYHDEGNFVNGITYRLIMPLRAGSEATAGAGPDLIFACQFWLRRTDKGYWSGDWQSVTPEIMVIDDLTDRGRTDRARTDPG